MVYDEWLRGIFGVRWVATQVALVGLPTELLRVFWVFGYLAERYGIDDSRRRHENDDATMAKIALQGQIFNG